MMVRQSLEFVQQEDNGRFKSFLATLTGNIAEPLKHAVGKIEIQTKYGLDVVIYLDEFEEPVAVHMFRDPKP